MLEIDANKCNGCKNLEVAKCVDICPGDVLFLNKNGKTEPYDPTECWDCFACVKECPRGALSIRRPFQINESLARLKASHIKENTVFDMYDSKGSRVKRFVVRSLDPECNNGPL